MLCEKYMGQFPVISITLKNISGLDFREAYTALRRVIGMEARRFSCLEKSDRLNDGDKDLYRALKRSRAATIRKWLHCSVICLAGR